MDDVFGGPAAPSEGPTEAPDVNTQAPGAAGDGGAKKPEEIGMDDVFGAPTADPPRKLAPREAATPTISPTKGLIDPENPGADKGGPAPTSSYNGKLKTRFRLVSSLYYDVDRAKPKRISRNENRLELYVAYTPNKHVQVVADAEPVLMGVNQARELDDLASQVYIQRFEERTKALGAQYSKYCPLEGHCVNGQLAMGENIGDLGGLSMAYTAYHLSLKGKEAPIINGLTGDQRFFLGWAQVWRRNYREQNLSQRITTDPHSPSIQRTWVSRNLDPWYKAYGIKEGQKLYLAPKDRVRIW